MICCATHKVYCDACWIPRSVLKSYISTSSLELELLDCLTVHSQRISSDLGDTSGNFFDILRTQIFIVLFVITNIRGADSKKNGVQIGLSLSYHVKKDLSS